MTPPAETGGSGTQPFVMASGGLLAVPGGLTQLGDAGAGICIDGSCAVPTNE